MKCKDLYAVLAAVGALALLLGGLGAVSIVSAQEPTSEPEDAPGCAIWGWGRDLFGFGRGGQWTMFDAVAEALGLTPDEFFTELHAGKSLEELAEEQGVDLEALQEALNAAQDEAMRDAIEQAVEGGTISQEQADWLLEGLEKGFMPRGRGLGPGFGRGMRGGFGGFAPQSDQSTPTVPSSSSL